MSEEIDDAALADEWAAALAEAGEEGDPAAADALADMQAPAPEVQRAPFDDLEPDPGAGIPENDVNLDVIMDIPVTISMEVGSTHIPIRNLLQLNQGSVVELDRLAGEPLDVTVNGTLIAHGEVVVVNEKYGIRLTDVISPQERIKKLK
ncbi:flagellar motor switch protein FliN [Endothiovibrio diazotrophicus]